MITLVVTASLLAVPEVPGGPSEATEFFESRVRPVFVDQCSRCHGERKQRGGLRLDRGDLAIRGGESGPAIIPGRVEESLLVRAVRHDGDLRMPPQRKLAPEQIRDITRWVELGAPWPRARAREEAAAPGEPVARADLLASAPREHWAFQPVRAPPIPSVRRAAWPSSPLDFFVLRRLEEAGLEPAPRASPRVLARRVTYDLTGLPPTPEEVDAFAADSSPEAYERLVDRLLASPRYGERWGRHWLDVARYADTKGYVFTAEPRYPYAYTYRDYVIRAFNEDLPYDRFVLEQVAADHLDLGDDPRPLAALGFLTLGRRFSNNIHDIIDDRIDVVTRGLMGLTVSCARCHDHKYDPIPTEDYYSLYGIFRSAVEPEDLPVLGEPLDEGAFAEYRAELARREKARDDFVRDKHRDFVGELQRQAPTYLAALVGSTPKTPEGAGLSLGRDDVRPAVLERWRRYLVNSRTTGDPVFAPWHELVTLPREGFAEAARAIVKRWSETSAANPHVVAALAARVPATVEEVAERYGEIFEKAEHLANDPAGGEDAGAGSTSAGAGWEEILRVLHGPDAPPAVSVEEATRLFDRDIQNQRRELERRIEELKVTHPGAPPRPMLLRDGSSPHAPRVFRRGKPGQLGARVPRRLPAILSSGEREEYEGSGRLELARAIASEENPLTARVLVNRVWLWHFGAPLVRTPSDFGTRSDPPTHPELLDHLASYLFEHEWSVKALHRAIVLSSTYCQSATGRKEQHELDPENRWLWRMNRRRLEFEALRDSILSVSGTLELSMGGRPVDLFRDLSLPRRSIYGMVDRQDLPQVLRSFDFPSPDATNPRRPETIVPQQALFLLNSPFVLEAARRVSERDDLGGVEDPAERARQMYRIILCRDPGPEELDKALRFVSAELAESSGEGSQSPGPWARYAQVLLLTNEFLFID